MQKRLSPYVIEAVTIWNAFVSRGRARGRQARGRCSWRAVLTRVMSRSLRAPCSVLYVRATRSGRLRTVRT